MQQWIDEAAPDVLLLQEVRAEPEIAQSLLGDRFDTFVAPSNLKGRAGVAVAVAKDSSVVGLESGSRVHAGLAAEEIDVDTGRWLEVDAVTHAGRPVRLVSAYFHAGQINHPKQEAKMRHLGDIDRRMSELRGAGAAKVTPASEETDAALSARRDEGNSSPHNQQVLVSGDFNIVRSQSDIKNWKGNYNRTSGVLDEEMVYLNSWVNDGWSDVVRSIAGDTTGPYSWWSWRGKAFDNDAGWRIDYHFASPELGQAAAHYRIDRARSWDTRFSDHAPVVVAFEV